MAELQKCLLGVQGLAEPIRGRRICSIILTLQYSIYFYLFFNVLKMFQENIPTYGGNQTHWWDPRTWPPSYTSERQVHLHFSIPQRRFEGLHCSVPPPWTFMREKRVTNEAQKASASKLWFWFSSVFLLSFFLN